MSIVTVVGHTISALITKKITFAQAAAAIEAQAAKVFGQSDAANALVSDLKQSASDAITVGASALGSAALAGAQAIEAMIDTDLPKIVGQPEASDLTPAIDKGIDDYTNTLIAAIQARALAWKNAFATASDQLVQSQPKSEPEN